MGLGFQTISGGPNVWIHMRFCQLQVPELKSAENDRCLNSVLPCSALLWPLRICV